MKWILLCVVLHGCTGDPYATSLGSYMTKEECEAQLEATIKIEGRNYRCVEVRP